ncbi:N-acetyltransferase 9 [Borealophlyctis nickersoniae]|nr:N-acetyltransferase 9 [Borealophlyctis nickersoniae]
MTASEPLTLDEEYDMQKSWHDDEKKCTFIILAPTFEKNRVGVSAKWGGMIGDVNLFFNDHDDPHSAEIEIMVAESSCRRQGYGLQALILMIRYAITDLNTTRLTAKISIQNTSSIVLFMDKLGFSEISRSEIFGEVTLEKVFSSEFVEWVMKDGPAEFARFE